jgi:uncharacterized protein YqeY
MKERQTDRVVALRIMLSALDNATAVEVDASHVPMMGRNPDVPRKELSEEQQFAILRSEAESRHSTLRQYQSLGKKDEVARLRAELDIFALYLDDR